MLSPKCYHEIEFGYYPVTSNFNAFIDENRKGIQISFDYLQVKKYRDNTKKQNGFPSMVC